jgi:HEAT repeat protein
MRFLVALWILIALPSTAWTEQARPQTPKDAAAVLGEGWTALGAQQPARAIEAARRLLKSDPGNHDALALEVAALTAPSQAQPIQALDAYERWLNVSKREDIFLLQPIAMSLLRQLAQSTEPRVRLFALAALAENGDAEATQALQALIAEQGVPVEIDASLAQAGDQAATARLEKQVAAGGIRDTSRAIYALERANARGATKAIIGALKHSAPPTRMAAANALAAFGATEAIPALKEMLNDPEPPVKNMAAVALARLGDSSGGVTLQSLENSSLSEYRLMAATSAARENPAGPWADKVQPLLVDPDTMVRLGALRLLLDHGRENDQTRQALSTALADPTPAVRTEAAGMLRAVGRQRPGAQDLPSLRRLLRDRLPEVQIEAAGAMLDGPR